ncbi:MAG TPA: fructosamine kinase family protein [Xanthomonadaceae bacterium]|nr:fructosamine kinase family protein [Xanthomonadaceae bacterium]
MGTSTAIDIEAAATALGDGLHRLHVAGRSVIVKHDARAPADFFAAEARGLEALALASALRTPQVLGHGANWIAMEDLGAARPGAGYWARAGSGLACLHRVHSERFGFDRDGYCGPTPQANTPMDDGHTFFAQCRLLPQLAMARNAGHLSARECARGEHIAQRLDSRVPVMPPVLLHGDLWLGNLHCCGNGEPALIDGGAVHHGWAEAEQAMVVLFGEPGRGFFEAYAAHAPLARDWRERAPLYNLYHLLNHLNLFGSGYHGQVAAVLQRYG